MMARSAGASATPPPSTSTPRSPSFRNAPPRPRSRRPAGPRRPRAAPARQEPVAVGDPMPVTLTVYTRGHDNVTLAYAEVNNDALPFLSAPIIISPASRARLTQPIIARVAYRP